MKQTTLIPLNAIPVWVIEDCRMLTEIEMEYLLDLDYRMNTSGGRNLITVNRQILDLPQFANFRDTCQEYLDAYVHQVLHITNKFRITDSWSTRNPRGTIHPAHTHGNSIFSGVYYAQIQSGALEFLFERQFSKDFNFKYNFSEFDVVNSGSYYLDCKPGMMVIFPSWLEHLVRPNEHDQERIIVGFNSFVQGKLGSDTEIDNITIC